MSRLFLFVVLMSVMERQILARLSICLTLFCALPTPLYVKEYEKGFYPNSIFSLIYARPAQLHRGYTVIVVSCWMQVHYKQT